MIPKGPLQVNQLLYFLTMDWICLFLRKLWITATVWLQLEVLSNSFSLSSGISLSRESKLLILESKCGIQQRWYRTKCTNTWLSCFGRKILCRKMLLWYLAKYKVRLSSYSTSCNISLDYSPQKKICVHLQVKLCVTRLMLLLSLGFVVHYLTPFMNTFWFRKKYFTSESQVPYVHIDDFTFILNICFDMCLSKKFLII